MEKKWYRHDILYAKKKKEKPVKNIKSVCLLPVKLNSTSVIMYIENSFERENYNIA